LHPLANGYGRNPGLQAGVPNLRTALKGGVSNRSWFYDERKSFDFMAKFLFKKLEMSMVWKVSPGKAPILPIQDNSSVLKDRVRLRAMASMPVLDFYTLIYAESAYRLYIRKRGTASSML
jgi:hypothetical protein